MTLLQEFLVNGGAGIAVEAGLKLREFLDREYFARDQVDRLLLLIDDEFADPAQLAREDFLAWREDPSLRRCLEVCIAQAPGEGSHAPEFIALIEPRLIHTATPDRHELAEQIAAFAWNSAPLTVEALKESTALLVDRIERQGDRIDRSISELFKDQDWRNREMLGEALLRGPLIHAKAEQLISDAQRLGESDPRAGAVAMLEACRRLREAGLDAIAESYEEQAAELLVAADDGEQAAELLAEVAGARLDRGSELCRQTLGRIEKLEAGKPAWLDSLLSALYYWPVDPVGSTKECLRAAEAPDLPESWLARIVELLLLLGENRAVVHLAETHCATVDEVDFRIRLCAAEGRALLDRDGASWEVLLSSAESQSDAELRGTVWQRRGNFLAMSDEVNDAIQAYRRAMNAWSRLPDSEEQVAEGFYSILNISTRAGHLRDEMELMPLASELRGASSYPAARAERLEQSGMAQRLEGKLREALFSYSRALLIHRRSGSFYGTMRLHEHLGELNEQAGEPLAALLNYIGAGKGKEASALARQCDYGELTGQLRLDGPSWQRAAEYRVIAEVGEEFPPEFVAAHLEQTLADTREPFMGFFSPSVSVAARLALCVMSLKIRDPDLREEALEVIRDDLTKTFVENTRAATRALALGTELGLWDERELLVDTFITDSATTSLTPGWASEQALVSDRFADRLQAAALDGSIPALKALAMAEMEREGLELISGDRALVELCNGHLADRDLASVHRSTSESGVSQVSVGMGVDLSGLGILGNCADTKVRHQLVRRLLDLIGIAEEPENHRASAVGALLLLVPSFTEEEATRVVETLGPIAGGSYPASPWDANSDHPFSAMRVSMHINQSLRAAGLQCIARTVASFPQLGGEWLGAAIVGALTSEEPLVVRAGLLASVDLPTQVPLALIEPHFRNDRPYVRADALGAWVASGEELPGDALALVRDATPRVRMRLAELSDLLPVSQAAEILAVLAQDPDMLISSRAQAAIENAGLSTA